MKVTKYEHACLVVEELGQHLVIDPGMFAVSLPADLTGVAAVVITHMHGDHLDKSRLQKLLTANPDTTVIAPQDVLAELQSMTAKKEIAEPGVSHTAGSFEIDFYGHDHAVIFEKVPCQNVGVLVNKSFYYPGDSFTKPGLPVTTLAVPSGAPWMKIGEAMDFIGEIKPKQVFPTHNVFYNEDGNGLADSILSQQASAVGSKYVVLEPGQSLET